MAPSKRYDVHRPSSAEFDPQKYEFKGVFCSDDKSSRAARTECINILQNAGWKFGAGSTSQCGHCGAAIRYSAIMLRRDVKEFIIIGETCLGNRFPLSKAQFSALRKTMKTDRERVIVSECRDALVAAHPVLSRLDELVVASSSNFLWSVRDQLNRRGVLSDKQIAAVVRAAERIDQQAVRKADWAARDDALRASGVNAPEGKGVKVQGTVLTRKNVISDYGDREVMMVQHADGWKVWSTVPASILPQYIRGIDGNEIVIDGAEVGDVIEFTADLAHFPDSNLISKATRPRAASIITKSKED